MGAQSPGSLPSNWGVCLLPGPQCHLCRSWGWPWWSHLYLHLLPAELPNRGVLLRESVLLPRKPLQTLGQPSVHLRVRQAPGCLLQAVNPRPLILAVTLPLPLCQDALRQPEAGAGPGSERAGRGPAKPG